MKTIDIHAHIVPQNFPADPSGGKNNRWPSMQCDAKDPSRATVMMGVPTFYTRLLDTPGFDRTLTAHMRLFTSGSAPRLPTRMTLLTDAMTCSLD